MSNSRAQIISVGQCIPEREIPNEFFDKLYQKDVGSFLREQRNIFSRRWMLESQSTSDLAVIAAKQAIAKADLRANDLDLIIIATDTPDYLSPSTASVVQYRLGATKAGSFDVNSACAGFVTALDIGGKFICADQKYKNVLVIGAYAMSKFINFEDYKIASLFADGAGAVILQAVQKGEEDELGILASHLWTDGQYHDFMGIYAGGSWKPFNQDVLDKKEYLLSFPKRIPPETNGLHWPRMAKTVLSAIEKCPQDVKHFMLTQFNIQSINETLDRLEVPRALAHLIMDRYGYTGSASIAMCLADAAEQRKLKKGDLMLLIGSGGGLSMASMALRWSFDT